MRQLLLNGAAPALRLRMPQRRRYASAETGLRASRGAGGADRPRREPPLPLLQTLRKPTAPSPPKQA
jgi:hypothetical protein